MEKVLYSEHPAMFRNHPLGFVGGYLLMLAGLGVMLWYLSHPWLKWVGLVMIVFGAVYMLMWWLKTLGTTLTVTEKRTTLRRGILAKHTNEVMHASIRNIQIQQSFLQRLFNVGAIGISSAGQAGVEIEVFGVPYPDKVQEIIDKHREL